MRGTRLKLLSWCLMFMLILGACAPVQEQGLESAQEISSSVPSQPAPLRIALLKGPTSMGLAATLDQSKEPSAFEAQILAAPDQVAALLVKGDVDIAAVPSNLAATLYKKTKGQIRVISINTLGVLSLATQDPSIKSMSDLKGKTIFASGKGTTPEFILRYLLEANGVKEGDVSIEWKAEHTEVVSALAADPLAVGLLPEPFLSMAEVKMPKLKRALDLTKVWETTPGASDSALVMGVFVARKEVVEQKRAEIEAFLTQARGSVEQVNQDPAAFAKVIDRLGIVPEKAAKLSIPHANLVAIDGEKMKAMLDGYLQVLHRMNPKTVGGALPDADFYFIPER